MRLTFAVVLLALALLALWGALLGPPAQAGTQRRAHPDVVKTRTTHRTAAASRTRRLALERGLAKIDFQSVERAKPISQRQARKRVAVARQKLKVDYLLDWSNPGQAVVHYRGRPIVVPRGLVQSPGLTPDGLDLILAHEAAHAKGKKTAQCEAKADYWAARRGLRRLWGAKAFAGKTPVRPLKAAFSALHSQFPGEKLDLSTARPKIVINASGYPTTQSRWEIMEAGIAGSGLPHLPRRAPAGEPELLDAAAAAKHLGVPVKWLRAKATTPGSGLHEINLGDGPRFDKSELDELRGRYRGGEAT